MPRGDRIDIGDRDQMFKKPFSSRYRRAFGSGPIPNVFRLDPVCRAGEFPITLGSAVVVTGDLIKGPAVPP